MKDIFDQVPEIIKTPQQLKSRWIQAAHKSLEHLIVVMEEPIITYTEDDVSSDRLKGAVQAKKIAAFDYLEILQKINEVETVLENGEQSDTSSFAEQYAK